LHSSSPFALSRRFTSAIFYVTHTTHNVCQAGWRECSFHRATAIHTDLQVTPAGGHPHVSGRLFNSIAGIQLQSPVNELKVHVVGRTYWHLPLTFPAEFLASACHSFRWHMEKKNAWCCATTAPYYDDPNGIPVRLTTSSSARRTTGTRELVEMFIRKFHLCPTTRV
jgi:hypothetical protein